MFEEFKKKKERKKEKDTFDKTPLLPVQVAILDVNETAGESLVEELNKQHGSGTTLFVKCDVESEEQIKGNVHKKHTHVKTQRGKGAGAGSCWGMTGNMPMQMCTWRFCFRWQVFDRNHKAHKRRISVPVRWCSIPGREAHPVKSSGVCSYFNCC